MLISILANLVQIGGVVPPTPTPHGGGGEIDFGLQSGRKAEEDELALRRKKILEQDDEDWMLFIHNLIVTNNLN